MNWNVLSLLSLGMLALVACDSGKIVSEPGSVSESSSVPVLNLSTGEQTTVALARKRFPQLALVHLAGEVRHFGADLSVSPAKALAYRATVANAHLWMAEYPFTKNLNIQTDSAGRWELYVLKFAQDTLRVSFVYEKDFYSAAVESAVFGAELPAGWNTGLGKSNILDIVDQDIEDLGMQFADELYLYYAKLQLEGQMSKLIGSSYSMNNIVVVTVGKTWASLFSDSLPHGDPGALTVISPATSSPLQGPIYFDEHVQPNPTYTTTSVDGGVLYNNLAAGSYRITATKAPYSYPTVQFEVVDAIHFYVASPPHSIQGSNTSLPGKN